MSKVISIFSYQEKLRQDWKSEKLQDFLKNKMDPEDGNDRYPHYRSWIVNSGLELLRIEGTTGIFKVKAMFYADRLANEHNYAKALLETLQQHITPRIDSFKVSPHNPVARVKYAGYNTRRDMFPL